MLTVSKIKSAKPALKAYQLTDAQGLFLLVKPNGAKLWRVRFQKNGKRTTLSAGVWPAVSLAEARRARDDLKDGVIATQANDSFKLFRDVALEWHGKQSNTWSDKHSKTVIQRLEKNVFNLIGHLPINDITPKIVLDVLLKIEKRRAFETAHRVKSIIGQVFRYGIPHEYCERDITQDLRGALTPTRPQHFASINNPAEIGVLLNMIDEYNGHVSTLFALKIMPHVFVRSHSFRFAEWSEFDFDQGIWSIPASKMKKSEPLIVPLSTQVIDLLMKLKSYALPSKYLFMGVSPGKPISDNTMRLGLRRIGYTNEQMSIHGFRHMASTRLNEMGFDSDLIEKQLAHTSGDKVRSAYNHAQWLPQRKAMMQRWSDYLDGLKII